MFHSSSYTANPIACAAALANVEIWRDEPVGERIARLSARQAEGLASLARLPRVSNPRQIGTIIALDVDADSTGGYLSGLGPRLLKHFRSSDTTLRPLGNVVYAMPPYSIEAADLQRLFDVIAEAVHSVRLDH